MSFKACYESQLFQFRQENAMNKPYIPRIISISSHSYRLTPQNKPTCPPSGQLMNASSCNRTTYRLRMKSDLNIDTLREVHRRYYHQVPNHTNSNNTRSSPIIPRQRINSKKSIVDDELKGLKGTALHVETLDKLLQQFDNKQLSSLNHFDTSSSFTFTNHLSKSSSLTLARTVRQPQALTEYRFNTPILSRASPRAYRSEETKKSTAIDFINQSHSLEQHSLLSNPHDRRTKESCQKSALHTDKRAYISNRLNTHKTMKSKPNDPILPISKHPSARFIFTYMRPCRYLIRQVTDEFPRLSSLPNKKILEHSIYDDAEQSQLFNNQIQSLISHTNFDDDLQNPPNTIVSGDFRQDN